MVPNHFHGVLAQHCMSSICLALVTHHVIMLLPAVGFGTA